MNETARKRITVTSSLHEISMELMGNRAVVKGGGVTPSPLSTAGFWTDASRRRERFFLHLGYFLRAVNYQFIECDCFACLFTKWKRFGI
jgi:hypothetical protein